MTSDDDKTARDARARAGIKARHDAVSALIERHKEEFEQLVTANRVAAGLPIRPQGPTEAQLEERIQREEKRLEKWREQLRKARGGEAAA